MSQAEPAGPSLRLVAASPRVTGTLQGRFLFVDPGVFVAVVGGGLEFRAWRADYDRPLMLAQVDPVTGMPLRSLPGRLARGFRGLRDFVRVTLRAGAVEWSPLIW